MGTTGWFATVRGDAWTLPRLKGRETQPVVWFEGKLLLPGSVTGPDVDELPSAPGWSSLFIRHVDYDVAAVEQALVDSIIAADTVGFVAYLQQSDWVYLTAIADAQPVARLVADPLLAIDMEEGHWALSRCRQLHGFRWSDASVHALAHWSLNAPMPIRPDALLEMLEWPPVFDDDFVKDWHQRLGFPMKPYAETPSLPPEVELAQAHALDIAEHQIRGGGLPLALDAGEEWPAWNVRGPGDWAVEVLGAPIGADSQFVEVALKAYPSRGDEEHDRVRARCFVMATSL